MFRCNNWLALSLSACLFAGLLSVIVLEGDLYAQVELNPNQIVGTIEFTNTNPDILDIFNPSGSDEGFDLVILRADSIGISPPLNNFTFVSPQTRTSTAYEITVESSDAGIPYAVSVEMRLDFGGDRYLFNSADSEPVFPEPAPDETVDLSECAGVLDIKFEDGGGTPLAVQGGSITARRETSPSSGLFILQAQDFSIPDGSNQEFLAVRGDGSQYRVDVTFEIGTDPFADEIRFLHQAFVTVSCDEIVEITCVVPPVGDLGEIVGIVDMEGEDEHQLFTQATRMQAFSGPFNNRRLDVVETSPSQGLFSLPNLMPSDAETPPRGYSVGGQMVFRTGNETEFFQTPFLFGTVLVEAGMTTDLRDTFVLSPGFVSGNVLLAGPPTNGGTSCLEALFRDADIDSDGDGIPNNFFISSGSNVSAFGRNVLATGATKTAQGGSARVGFEGSFNATTDNFEGNYEMVLGGLLRESSIWRPSGFSARLSSTATPNQPETFQSSSVFIQNFNIGDQEIVPTETVPIDHAYCFSQLNLEFRSVSGTFFNPRTNASGVFLGTDFQTNPANYFVSGFASGTPTSTATASNQGLVVMCIAQGSYTFTPTVTAINPGGGTSNTESAPIEVEVGCRQILSLTTQLQISLDQLPQCTAEAALGVSGSVSSDGNVVEVFSTHNEGPDSSICTDCGEDPSFSFELELEECDNEITVTARDEFDNEASVTTFITKPRFDGVPPVLSGCEDISVQPGEGETSAVVTFEVAATDNCDAAASVSCDPPSGSSFLEGETTVTCTTQDTCGNESECSFTVTVATNRPPECSDAAADPAELWPPNHKFVDVSIVGVTDPDGDPVTITIVSIFQDERVTELGAGSGNTSPDGVGVGTGTGSIRAERNGNRATPGDGRVYHVAFSADDGEGGECSGAVLICVPHDQAPGTTCVDGGPLYDSTIP